MPRLPALGRVREKDGLEFEASLVYTTVPDHPGSKTYLKTQTIAKSEKISSHDFQYKRQLEDNKMQEPKFSGTFGSSIV